MSDFDELIDADVTGEQRERLRGVHELLVEAGPPPELPVGLQHVPAPGELRRLRPRYVPRKVALLAAALIVLGTTFSVGYATGNQATAPATHVATLALKGTAAAPHARATLDVLPPTGGNWPMTLAVSGLPRVAAPTYYVVWLVRNGKPWAPCGEFVVSKPSSSLTLTLTAPYSLRNGDRWIVTRQRNDQLGAGVPVLRPA
ncbi:MAG TPA: hypothetical protein VMU72_00010 [Gaiellaceae bacterium]|nr:hypothetical protein [Gaiellaceae bacterium]